MSEFSLNFLAKILSDFPEFLTHFFYLKTLEFDAISWCYFLIFSSTNKKLININKSAISQ